MGWYNPNWQYRRKLTIDHTTVPSDLTDFPLLFQLFPTNAGLNILPKTETDGSDIVVTKADGTTKLPRDFGWYNKTQTRANIYIKTDISSSVDTILYFYYGYSEASETNDPLTWRDEYIHVAHCSDSDPTTSVVDSSQTGNDGVGTSVTSVLGGSLPYAPSIKFDDIPGNNVVFSDVPEFDISPDISIQISARIDDNTEFSGWVQRCNADGSGQIWTYFYDNVDGVNFRFNDSTEFASGYTLSNNAGYRECVTFSDSNNRVRHFINGTKQGGDIACTKSLNTGSSDLVYGQEGSADFLDGNLKEVRIYAGELSEDWVSFDSDNIFDSEAIISIAAEETKPTVKGHFHTVMIY